jgi:2-dehydro-3-deoxygluconokinase
MPQIVCFGECMVELSRTMLGGKSWNLGFAGDTYNVAVYIQRLGLPTAYMTAIGEDEFSAEMKAMWESEGINTALALHHANRVTGLYAIRLDEAGERSFTYWRSQSAARAFFQCSGAEAALAKAATTRLLYLSGITLSLFTHEERSRILRLAEAVRANSGQVAFDTNYRAKGWPDKNEALEAFTAFGRLANFMLPTLEDDCSLFGEESAENCADRWLALGADEVVVKQGERGALVTTRTGSQTIEAQKVSQVKDTTGAGDSFNAAYLANRVSGKDAVAAAMEGALLAATVVQHPGAILPRVLMPIKRLG